MKNWYFTFGSWEKFPYQHGWVRVVAETETEAIEKFNTRFGLSENGFVNCAFWYSEEKFKQTSVWINGNGGMFEHEVIE